MDAGPNAERVRQMYVEEGLSLAEVSAKLKFECQHGIGLSERSLKRFCHDNNIVKRLNYVNDATLDEHVVDAVQQVGGKYGRKMMCGLLRSTDVGAAECRVGAALKRVAPEQHTLRFKGAERQMNPQKYYADYFGYNLHMDQNEKLVDFGVTFVLAIDGLSSFIPAYAVMPIKNNSRIYNDVLRLSYSTYGMWDTVIVDHGREFYLSLFAQQYLKERLTADSTRVPYKQIKSTTNNRIERVWSEVNQRVSYPLKFALLDLEQKSQLSHHDSNDLFSMSSVCCPIAAHGVSMCINSWNYRTIPGRGVPASFVADRSNCLVPEHTLLTTADAVSMYRDCGGCLTDETTAGVDPVLDPDIRLRRDNDFWHTCDRDVGSISQIFGACVNNDYSLIQAAVRLHRQLSQSFEQQ